MISDKKIVNVASYNRLESLLKSVESVINQCDKINITLNSEIKEIPNILLNKKVNLIFSDNSYGDSMKFFNLENENGYFLTIDDDLIYPVNYVDYMINKCIEYENRKVITLHGRNFEKFPISGYYKSATKKFHFSENVEKDTKVQFGGTGLMCFHTNLIKIPFNYFKAPNMADVWIGKYCMENKIDIICVKHSSNFVEYIPQEETIYDTHSRKDTIQTLVVNSIFDKNIDLNFDKKIDKQPDLSSKAALIAKIINKVSVRTQVPQKNQIKYEVINNVTQHRINQKSQYMNVMVKTKKIPQQYFKQNTK
jgi:hypothetical protein